MKKVDTSSLINKLDKWNERQNKLLKEYYDKQLILNGVSKRNWFERLPLHWRYIYYMIGGIVIGYLLHYVC